MPKFCHVIERKLCLPDDKRKYPLGNFLTSQKFEKWVVEDAGFTFQHEDERKVCVDYLDSSGIVRNETDIIPGFYCRIDCES